MELSLPGVDTSCVYLQASMLGCFHSTHYFHKFHRRHWQCETFRADFGRQMWEDKDSPFISVTSCDIVWRKDAGMPQCAKRISHKAILQQGINTHCSCCPSARCCQSAINPPHSEKMPSSLYTQYNYNGCPSTLSVVSILQHTSKHDGSNSHPVRISWEALARSGPDDSCTPACFRTGSVWPKTWHSQPDLNRIRAGFAKYYPECLWKNGTESESRKLAAGRLRPARNRARWFLRLGLLPDQIRLAKPWPGHLDRFCTMWSMSSLEKWSWNGCGKLDPAHTIRPDSGSMLAVMAITGRNQNPSGSDPACLLGLNAVRVPQEDIKPSLALRERSVERGSPQWSSLKGWERTITKWMNIGTASKATLGKLLTDEVECALAFSSAYMPSRSELNCPSTL